MKKYTKISTLIPVSGLLFLVCCQISGARTSPQARSVTIICPSDATSGEHLAAKEIRRYLYLRTGELLPIIHAQAKLPPPAGLIVVGQKERSAVQLWARKNQKLASAVESLKSQQYLLKTVKRGKQPALLITGGDAIGTLYAAYRFAEHLGVRFYLHGDTIPDERIAMRIPNLDEQGKPLFNMRGIQPFHDFPEGPDWWNTDDYKAIVAQLPKLRMNFFGLHTYPQGGVGPEPTVWIGMPGEFNEDGTVKFSYPSRHFTTANVTGAWGYKPTKTSDYSFGAAQMFERDDYGAEYMRRMNPWTQLSEEKANELFDRMGEMLKEAFEYAGALGVKTCVGTETPLVIPNAVKERIKAAGKDPADPAVVQELYEGMFRRIAKAYPLDYYWFWTPEGWTWGNPKDEQIEATLADFRTAIAAAKKVKAPFTLATCGWVLGPPKDRALFDNSLPKEMPMSCINRNVGFAPVEPGFADIEGRPQWAIPWLEDDPAMIIPQLWAGRMRRDAADALAYGCTGLMGIHWRTRILGPNVSALAHAAWDQSRWNPEFGKKPKPIEPKLSEGHLGGNTAAFPNNTIIAADDHPLYQTVRYNTKGYRIKVPNGAYIVTLKFCEPHYNEKAKRIFGVRLQGKTVIDHLDIFEQVGKNKALHYVFANIKVVEGFVNIDFDYQLEYPSIAAIVVEGKAVARKINCGGPAYNDYQADLPAAGSDPKPRDMPAYDFYLDWATAQFGPEAAEPIARLFTSLDGGPSATAEGQRNTNLPRPSTWVRGPGGIKPDSRPWEQVRKEYEFVDHFCLLAPRVRGPGNKERFRYWLYNFRYLRAVGNLNCTWARFNEAMKKIKETKDDAARKKLARETALPIRKQLVGQVAEAHAYLLRTVNTPGAMGNVANWQQHLIPTLLTGPGEELAKILGEELPSDAMPSTQYIGRPRLIVPTVRGSLMADEDLKLKIIFLDKHKPEDAALYWRPMGRGSFKKTALSHVARGVYSVEISAEQIQKRDLEYYIKAAPADATDLTFPAGAPRMTQTVVIMGR